LKTEARKEYERGWRERNKEHVADYMKDYGTRWYEENKESVKEKSGLWYAQNRERKLATSRLNYAANRAAKCIKTRELNERLKADCFKHYSSGLPSCRICGEYDIDMLVLDHVNDNGAEERKLLSGSGKGLGSGLYRYLNKLGYPDGYQVLCSNHNLKKQIRKVKESFNRKHGIS
jgi:hypothetical protein